MYKRLLLNDKLVICRNHCQDDLTLKSGHHVHTLDENERKELLFGKGELRNDLCNNMSLN